MDGWLVMETDVGRRQERPATIHQSDETKSSSEKSIQNQSMNI